MELLLLSSAADVDAVLPPLTLLSHVVRVVPPVPASLEHVPAAHAIVLDALGDLGAARRIAALFSAAAPDTPMLVVMNEGALIALGPEWGATDFVLATVGPAEVDARLRLIAARAAAADDRSEDDQRTVTLGELLIDEDTYTTRLRGRPVDLTYKEFELLKFLCRHPGRVYTRAQLLHEVWGYDYFGGTRTVDVHVRRLRAKLGSEYESMIGTVRGVGYKAVPAPETREAEVLERRPGQSRGTHEEVGQR